MLCMWIELAQISASARTNACSICGTNTLDVPALTSNVFIEFEGDIEICRNCIIQGADLYGMVRPEVLAAAVEELAELREWAEAAYEELAQKQSTIETIAQALANTAAERDRIAAEQEDLARSHRVGG
jgi:hypothetical protein